MFYLHDIQWIDFVLVKFNFRLPWLNIYDQSGRSKGIVLVERGHASASRVKCLEARAAMWERKPARRVGAAAFDGACGCWLASIPQGG